MQGVTEEDGYAHIRMSLFSVYPAKQFYRVNILEKSVVIATFLP